MGGQAEAEAAEGWGFWGDLAEAFGGIGVERADGRERAGSENACTGPVAETDRALDESNAVAQQQQRRRGSTTRIVAHHNHNHVEY